jgi:type IV pilus assembly protein PilB
MILEVENYIPKTQMLGEILIERNLINHHQLSQALEIQEKEKNPVGELLVKLGYVKELDIVTALVIQCNFPYIAIDKYFIEPSLKTLVPESTARKYQVVPFARVGSVLSLVMADPLDVLSKAELESLTQCRIASFIASREEILTAIDRSYLRE